MKFFKLIEIIAEWLVYLPINLTKKSSKKIIRLLGLFIWAIWFWPVLFFVLIFIAFPLTWIGLIKEI